MVAAGGFAVAVLAGLAWFAWLTQRRGYQGDWDRVRVLRTFVWIFTGSVFAAAALTGVLLASGYVGPAVVTAPCVVGFLWLGWDASRHLKRAKLAVHAFDDGRGD